MKIQISILVDISATQKIITNVFRKAEIFLLQFTVQLANRHKAIRARVEFMECTQITLQ